MTANAITPVTTPTPAKKFPLTSTPSKISVIDIRKEIETLETWVDGSGALMMVKSSAGLPPEIMKLPTVNAAIREIGSIRNQVPLHVMINIIPPGIEVPVHRDFLYPTTNLGEKPCLERWHLPIYTNEKCVFWDEKSDMEYHLLVGMWSGPVPYWLNHYVANRGTTPRLHLVVDLDSKSPVGEYKD